MLSGGAACSARLAAQHLQLLLSQPPLHCPQMALTRLRLFDKSKVN